MTNRLLGIALVQILALVGWGIYANYRLDREKQRADQFLVSGFNHGVDAMATGVLRSNVVKPEDAYKAVLGVQDSLQKERKDWSGLDTHLADWMIAIPSGVLSLVVIIALFVEAKNSQKRNGSEIPTATAPALNNLNEF